MSNIYRLPIVALIERAQAYVVKPVRVSLSDQARQLYRQRIYQARWIRARRYLDRNRIAVYEHLPIALTIVSNYRSSTK